MRLLDGRFAVITGAASARGLGKATAAMFAEHGATVAILDLDANAAEQAAADIGPEHLGLACDVTDKDDCETAATALLDRWSRIDVLMNNAGITQPLKIMDIEPENYEAVTDVSLRGMLYMVRLLSRPCGRSVPAVSSTCHQSPRKGAGGFSAGHTIRRRRPGCWD